MIPGKGGRCRPVLRGMRSISELTEYLFGTRSAPSRETPVHQNTEHRHWDRQTQAWVEHAATEEAEQAA